MNQKGLLEEADGGTLFQDEIQHLTGIVKDHGGDIRVASQPGQGDEFIVLLPVRQTPEQGGTDD